MFFPEIIALVVITTMVGYAMAPAPFDLATFAYCTVGTGKFLRFFICFLNLNLIRLIKF